MIELERLESEAFILHSRAFKENSIIAQLFAAEAGLFDVIVKSYKKGQMTLQPFNRLEVSWRGRAELKTLTEYNLLSGYRLTGTTLFCGLYLNELLLRLLHKHEPFPYVYQLYRDTVKQLSETESNAMLEVQLRNFELNLLDDMGYGIEVDHITQTGLPVEDEKLYYYVHNHGILENQENLNSSKTKLYSGSALKLVQQRDFQDISTRQTAKVLLREMLSYYIGDKPLKSRELFTRLT